MREGIDAVTELCQMWERAKETMDGIVSGLEDCAGVLDEMEAENEFMRTVLRDSARECAESLFAFIPEAMGAVRRLRKKVELNEIEKTLSRLNKE